MRKALSVVVAIAVALCPVVATAQPAPVKDPEVAKGLKALDDGDYDLAIFTLDSATRRLASDPRNPDLSQAYVGLGVAYVGKGAEAAAKAKFREALKQVRDLALSADKYPSKVINLFESARDEMSREAPSASSAAVTIDHQQVGCVIADRFPVLEARLDPLGSVGRARIHFRPAGGAHWYSVAMEPEAGLFKGVLPKPRKSLKKLEYYLEVTDKGLGTSRTGEYGTDVASGKGGCQDKTVAGALTSVTSLLVNLPSGAVGLPIVPAGFSASGVTAAAGAAGGSASTAAASGGVSKGLIIGAGVVGAGGLGLLVAKAGGGSDPADPRSTDDDGDGVSEAQGDCNDADRQVNPSGAVTASTAPLTGTSACGQPSPPASVSVSNRSCQAVTVTAIDLGRSDPRGICFFPSQRNNPSSPTVAAGETREVGRIGGGTGVYCTGGPVSSPYTCVDQIVVVVQSSAGSLAAGTYSINVQFDPGCTARCQ